MCVINLKFTYFSTKKLSVYIPVFALKRLIMNKIYLVLDSQTFFHLLSWLYSLRYLIHKPLFILLFIACPKTPIMFKLEWALFHKGKMAYCPT